MARFDAFHLVHMADLYPVVINSIRCSELINIRKYSAVGSNAGSRGAPGREEPVALWPSGLVVLESSALPLPLCGLHHRWLLPRQLNDSNHPKAHVGTSSCPETSIHPLPFSSHRTRGHEATSHP